MSRQGPRKLKPSTRIAYLRRDLNNARSILRWAAQRAAEIAREVDANIAGAPTIARGIASELRDTSSECEKWAHRLTGW